MSQPGLPPRAAGLSRREATGERIATAAAELVAADGLAKTTVEHIAEAAGVGRATFFRYFSTKEAAVADGMTRRWLDLITEALARQPEALSAHGAVVAAFSDLAAGFDAIATQINELAVLTRSSPVLSAWTLQVYVGYENAIADLVRPRLGAVAPDDPRPRLIGALAMASIRLALDDWLLHGGSLPDRVRDALTSYAIE